MYAQHDILYVEMIIFLSVVQIGFFLILNPSRISAVSVSAVVDVGSFYGAAYGFSINEASLEAFLGYLFGIGLSQMVIILISFSLFHKSR